MRAKNNILDTIECSTMGWQDKPPKMPKAERPLDGGETGQEQEERTAWERAPLQNAIMTTLRNKAPTGQWLMRETLVAPLHWTNEANITAAISALVKQGRIERSIAKGARMCYRLRVDAPAPEKPAEFDELAERMKNALSEHWTTSGGLAERLGHRTERIVKAGHRLVEQGWADVQRTDGLSKRETRVDGTARNRSGRGNENEWRASAKLLLSRINPH